MKVAPLSATQSFAELSVQVGSVAVVLAVPVRWKLQLMQSESHETPSTT